MFQWRWKLQQAKQAVKDGRFDEASRLLADPQLREFLPAKRLAEQLANKLASRAGERIAAGHSGAGFNDLAVAEQLATHKTRVAGVRDEYAARALDEVTRRLVAGAYGAARDEITRASRRGVSTQPLRLLGEVAALCHASEKTANQGDMGPAESSLAQAIGLVDSKEHAPVHKALTRQADALAIRSRSHGAARTRLNEALGAEDWSGALAAVEDAIRLAPDDVQAASARRQAWKKLGLEMTRAYHGPRTPPRTAGDLRLQDSLGGSGRRRAAAKALDRALRYSTRGHRKPEDDTVSGRPPVNRRMLWIDSVGALLVCLDDEILLGQPTADPARGPAVPVLADLSRRHAVLRREEGRYVLEPLGRVKVDGVEVSETTVLPDQCSITLFNEGGGDAVRFRFEKPHALSATARLTPESGHRLSPPADAVLLMADSCVMGPAAHCHVRCRDWAEDVVLYRQEGELCCRSKEPLVVDGVEQAGGVMLAGNPRIEGQDFAFTVESC